MRLYTFICLLATCMRIRVRQVAYSVLLSIHSIMLLAHIDRVLIVVGVEVSCFKVLDKMAHVVATMCFRSGTESESFKRSLNILSSTSCDPFAEILVEVALLPSPRTQLICEVQSVIWSVLLGIEYQFTYFQACLSTGCSLTLVFVPADQARLFPRPRRLHSRDNLATVP
jgi:hypothetical protein